MSQPLEQGTDYIGEDEEIREEDVECLLPLEEMELLRKEQEELDSALPETEVITQAVTLEEFSLVGDVLMRVNGADQDADKGAVPHGRCSLSAIPVCSIFSFPR